MEMFEFGLVCLGVGIVVGTFLGIAGKVVLDVRQEDDSCDTSKGPTDLTRIIKR